MAVTHQDAPGLLAEDASRDLDDRVTPLPETEATGMRREGQGASLWVRRLTAASLSSAAAIHLVLTPVHFQEHTLYGVFFLAAAVFQFTIAHLLVLAPTRGVYRAGLGGSVVLITIWLATRVVAPPLSETAEPVTLWGVLAKGLELTALFLLLALLPPSGSRGRTATTQRFAWGWALVTGVAFALLYLFASASLVYVPADLPGAPSVTVDPWQGPSLIRPWVEGPLTSHLYVNAPWSVLLLAPLAGLLLGAATGLLVPLMRLAPGSARPRRGYLATAPALIAVPSCCGVPLLGFLGAGAVPILFQAAPWLLLATTAGLAIFVLLLRHQWRSLVCRGVLA